MIGTTLAHYKVTEKIGAGGMGEVWRAADSKLGRDVALKMLLPSLAADPDRLARFRREAVVLAQLNHPNIGAIYGFEEAGDARALVLELVEGPTLHDVIRRGPVPVAEALPIARQIADAVEAAHERGVMHRDLKPANVKVTDDGRVKVLDFGLARALEGDAPAASSTDSPTMSPTLSPTLQSPVTGALTGANVILGTAAYMSPEQARGKPVDKRCDIWSFGVILFEMLTGRSLFAGETVSDTLAGVLKTEPDWDSLPPETPPRIVRLLRRCLERDPRKRLRDMGDARILITEVMEGRHEEAAPAGVGPVAAPRPARPWLAAVLLVAGLAGGAAIGWTLRPAPPEPEVRRFLIPIPEGDLEDAVISPDGRHLAYVLDDRLWIRAMDRIEPRMVEGTQGADSPTWSPDGSMIAFHAGDKLWRIGLADTKPTLIVELEGVASPRWQEDGAIVFVTDRALRRVSSRGGEVETLRELAADEAEDLHGVESLPGGKGWIVIVHDAPDKDTIALEAWTAEERKRILELPFEDANLWDPGYAEPGYVIYTRGGSNRGTWAVPFSLRDLGATGDPFLVEPEGIYSDVTRDGKTLTAIPSGRTTSSQLVWVGLDGSIGEPIGQPQERIWEPSLSPDGSTVAVRGLETNEADLWIHDVGRSTKTRLTFSDDVEACPQWSADGGTIYYTRQTSRRTSAVWRVPADGSGDPEELFPGGFASLSRDGRWMAFERWGEDDELNLWKWSADGGGEPEVFLDGDASEENAALSPDGRWIAYESDESGREEIYLKSFPSASGKWQVSVNGGQGAAWSPESDRLFFHEDDDLFQVEVDASDGLRLSAPKKVLDGRELGLFLSRRIAVAPGGERIIASRRLDPEGEEAKPEVHGILVVENWLEEFR